MKQGVRQLYFRDWVVPQRDRNSSSTPKIFSFEPPFLLILRVDTIDQDVRQYKALGRPFYRYPIQLASILLILCPGATDPLMTAFNESLPYDKKMHTADITGSKAYAQAIHKSGILSAHECAEILRGLDVVEQEWLENKFVAQSNDEDIHTANERRLGEIIGTKIAGKLHTGRSRNDQVATDMRIWTRDEGRKVIVILKELISVMLARAEKEMDVLMPGFTHLQARLPDVQG